MLGSVKFESRVILDGSQTFMKTLLVLLTFESRVILDGSQTCNLVIIFCNRFESRVILDGSQTTIQKELRLFAV